MKTLPALAFLAAFVAFVLLPLPFETAGSMLVVAALVAIAFGDYGRTRRPLRVLTALAATVPKPGRTERLRLAA